MEEKRLDRRTKYTHMVLKDSLIELLKVKPISKITVKEICQKADINRSTFYSHFNDPYHLLNSIEQEILQDVEKTLANYNFKQDVSQALQMMEKIFEYIGQNDEICQVLLDEKGDIAFQKQIMMLAQRQQVITQAVNRQIDQQTAEYICLFAVNGSLGIVQHWLKNGMKKTPKEMAEMVINLTNKGLAAFW